MQRTMLGNSHYAAAFIAGEERLQAMRKATQQSQLIRESAIAFGPSSDHRVATLRCMIGVALIRAGKRLSGSRTVAAQPSTQSANG